MLVIGGGPVGRGDRLLAGRGRPRRGRGRAQDASPARRPAATGSPPGPCTSSHEMGLAERLADFHRYDGLRACAHGIELELQLAGASGVPVLRLRRAPLATSTPWWPSTRSKSGAVLRQGTEAVAPLVARRPGRRSGGQGQGVGAHRGGAGPLRGDRRRRQLALRPRARHQPQPRLPAGHGHPRLLRQRHQRHAVDRERARRARPQRQLAARLRLDLPAGRRRRSTWASGCCRPSATSSPSTPPTS